MTVATHVAPFVPDCLVASAARWLYPRFERELRWLDRLCPPHGTALDVGAWYGPWTSRLSRCADRVVAIEPMPELARLLMRTSSGNVRVVSAAASDHRGSAPIWTSADGVGVRGCPRCCAARCTVAVSTCR